LECQEITSTVLPELHVVPVDLQIAKKLVQVSSDFKEGHFHVRDDAIRFYAQRSGNFNENEMFLHAKYVAEQEADKKFLTDKEKKAYIDRNGNILGFVGEAGVGKTTSIKKWVLWILDGKIVSSVSFLFFIRIRDIEFSKEMTVLQFLTESILPNWSHSETESHGNRWWIEQLYEDQQAVIALDGLDEAAVENLSQTVPKISLYNPTKPIYILMNLISGQLLPFARIIITSRPDRFYRVAPAYKPKFVFEILGLDEKGQDALGNQICDSWTGQVKSTLIKNPDLFAYCFVPVTFILTVDYLAKNSSSDLYDVCLTKILATAVISYWESDHWRRYELGPEFDKLSYLAWKGQEQMQIIFSMKQISDAGIDDETCQSFLITSILDSGNIKMKILNGKKRIYFSHLIWQEFFAAVHLMLYASEEVFLKSLQHMFDDRWEIVMKFLFGFCQESAYQLVEELACNNADYRPSSWQRKKEISIAYFQEQYSTWQAKDSSDESLDRSTAMWHKLLRVCSWIREANDEKVAQAFACIFRNGVILRGNVTPLHISNFFFSLRATNSRPPLVVQQCIFVSNSLQTFSEHVISMNIHVSIYLYLSNLTYGKMCTNKTKLSSLHILAHVRTRVCEISVCQNFFKTFVLMFEKAY